MPTNMDQYQNEEELFLRAFESPRGIRIRQDVPDAQSFNGWAMATRMRLHKARQVHRELSKDMYPPDDARWGRSTYDKLLVKINKDLLAIEIIPRQDQLDKLQIEEIEDDPASSG